jgi:EAL domain-containing protein (putative c-di-GMP-specific phosphodiesterase class I)/GGDEF domain-containing protein
MTPMPVSAYSQLLGKLQAAGFHPCAALVYVDLRHMRLLNRFGDPQHGDRLIREVSKVMAAWSGPRGVSGHLWSNEFIAAKAIDHAQAAVEEAEVLRSLLANIHYPTALGDNLLAVSIGLVVARPQSDWRKLISNASAACQTAKHRGLNQVVSHCGVNHESALDVAQAHLIVNFRKLLADDQLTLHAQPIMDISKDTARLAKAEFLIRQRLDNGVQTLPSRTIETLEHFGLSAELDLFSSNFILEWLGQNKHAARKLDSVSINLSAKSISNGDFVDYLIREVKNARLPPGKLCLEITETAAIEHLDVVAEVIAEFRDIGCKFSLDDFGAGMCSFGYLQSLPVDEVKIDGRFVHDVADNPVSQEIIRAIHQVAHATGKRSVAEFVDTPSKLAAIKQIGVDYAQGYLFSTAIPPEQLLAML